MFQLFSVLIYLSLGNTHSLDFVAEVGCELNSNSCRVKLPMSSGSVSVLGLLLAVEVKQLKPVFLLVFPTGSGWQKYIPRFS